MKFFIIIFLLMPIHLVGMELPTCNSSELAHWKNVSLVRSAAEGKLSSVKLLCKFGANVNFLDEEIGRTPLVAAIEADNEEIVTYLVDEKGADASQRAWSTYPMDKALEQGNGTIIDVLGNKNAKIRVPVNNRLQIALDTNKCAAIKYLLMKTKASVNETASQKITPLHWAAKNGEYELVSFLLENNAQKEALNDSGETPLFNATKYPAIARLLIEKGANINHCTPAHQNHRTPLFDVVWSQNSVLAQHFIEQGADLNIIDSHNKTPVYYAIEAGDEPMLKLLLEKGANPDLIHTKSVGYTPLAIAAKMNLVRPISLIAHGADVNLQDSYGDTALLHARTSGSTEAFNALVAAGANIKSAKNINGIYMSKLNPEIEEIVNRTIFQRFFHWTKNNSFSSRISNILNGARTKAANSWTRWENTRIIGGILKKLRIW